MVPRILVRIQVPELRINMLPKILFPFSPGTNKIDQFFEEEALAAKKAGFDIALIGTDLQFGSYHPEIRNIQDGDRLLYRGWMLKHSTYCFLSGYLLKFGASLIQPSERYQFTRDFPAWYNVIENKTPKSWWIKDGAITDLIQPENLISTLINIFGASSLILKDYVKSRKQDWHQACFIPNCEAAPQIVKNFLEIQGDELTGGLVFREFIEFKKIGIHSKSKMPLINEWRQFYSNGRMFYQAPYWGAEANYVDCAFPSPSDFASTAVMLDVPFLTIDVAADCDGKWQIIEIGDGGSSGIPEGGNVIEFYNSLYQQMKEI